MESSFHDELLALDELYSQYCETQTQVTLLFNSQCIRMQKTLLNQRYILGMKVNITNYEDATQQIIQLAQARKSSYVCLANVHMVMEAFDSAEFRQIINAADLVTPDGQPLSWSLKVLGVINQSQVCGRELTMHVCKVAELNKISVGFYGSSKQVLTHLLKNLKQSYPNLNITYAYSPPFRSLTLEEDDTIIQAIKSSGTQILFVGLGCPKQERWMAQHQHQIPTVMLGVGAAFDFLAGTKPIVPKWMQNIGLEWLFRLFLEPRRLWYRNFKHNPRFLAFFSLQILKILTLLALITYTNTDLIETKIYSQTIQIKKLIT